MKNLLGFMFGYGGRGNGVLGWNTRLSQPDHLYHQGRNCISMAIYALFLVAVYIAGIALASATGFSADGSNSLILVAVMVLLSLPMFYLTFATIKLTILRLHDFNLSGWWILYSLILMVADFCLEGFFPAFTVFVSVQSLVYLGLLIWPGSLEANKYGDITLNSTATKHRWVRVVPLATWVLGWVVGMLSLFMAAYFTSHAAESTAELETLMAGQGINLSAPINISPTLSNQ